MAANEVRVRCPRCRQESSPRSLNSAWPFCGDRCKLIDLGGWMDGDNRISVNASETERTGPREDELYGGGRLGTNSGDEPS
jgi:uncharacterized protein